MIRLRKVILALVVPGALAVAATAAFAYQRSADMIAPPILAPEDEPDPGIDFMITGPVGHSVRVPAEVRVADERPVKPVRHRMRKN